MIDVDGESPLHRDRLDRWTAGIELPKLRGLSPVCSQLRASVAPSATDEDGHERGEDEERVRWNQGGQDSRLVR